MILLSIQFHYASVSNSFKKSQTSSDSLSELSLIQVINSGKILVLITFFGLDFAPQFFRKLLNIPAGCYDNSDSDPEACEARSVA